MAPRPHPDCHQRRCRRLPRLACWCPCCNAACSAAALAPGSYGSQPPRTVEHPQPGTSAQIVIGDLEKRLSGMQQDFTSALHKISEKGNEKFDLIFAILSELQSRQAQLEESVRALKAQYGSSQMVGANQMVNGGTGAGNMSQQQQHSQQQFGVNSNGHYNQMSSQLGSQMGGQQFAGMMQSDGTQAMFTAMPQVVVVSSPNGAGMPYAMSQMMSPTGAMQMPPQMAMQFIGQGGGQEMGGFACSPDAGGGLGTPTQAQPAQGQLASPTNAATGGAISPQSKAEGNSKVKPEGGSIAQVTLPE